MSHIQNTDPDPTLDKKRDQIQWVDSDTDPHTQNPDPTIEKSADPDLEGKQIRTQGLKMLNK